MHIKMTKDSNMKQR